MLNFIRISINLSAPDNIHEINISGAGDKFHFKLILERREELFSEVSLSGYTRKYLVIYITHFLSFNRFFL